MWVIDFFTLSTFKKTYWPEQKAVFSLLYQYELSFSSIYLYVELCFMLIHGNYR